MLIIDIKAGNRQPREGRKAPPFCARVGGLAGGGVAKIGGGTSSNARRGGGIVSGSLEKRRKEGVWCGNSSR